MDTSLKEKLKSLSKDESSFSRLKEIYRELNHKKNHYEKHLNLLESAIDNDYDSILITELELDKPGPKIVYVNQGFTEVTGYSRDEVIGKTPRILQGPKTERAVLDRLKKRLENGRAFFGQTVNYRKDGSEFVNQWDIHPLTDSEGNITHWVSYQHDISERKRAEEKIIDTEAEFDELWENSKRTVLDVDKEGAIVTANKAFRNLTGYEKDELKGTKIWELFPRKYRNSLKTRFDKKFDRDDFEGQTFQGIIKHKQGLPIQIGGTAMVLDLKDGTIIRATIKNISLQKRVMETLKKRNKNYQKIAKQASEFTYKVSIDDGNPVFEYVSDEFSKITGITADDVIHANGLQKLVHEDDIESVKKHLNEVYDGKSGTCEYRIRTKDGSYSKVIDYSRAGTCTKHGETKCVRGAISFKNEEVLAGEA
jgi:PAS domain S-box-containing protein